MNIDSRNPQAETFREAQAAFTRYAPQTDEDLARELAALKRSLRVWLRVDVTMVCLFFASMVATALTNSALPIVAAIVVVAAYGFIASQLHPPESPTIEDVQRSLTAKELEEMTRLAAAHPAIADRVSLWANRRLRIRDLDAVRRFAIARDAYHRAQVSIAALSPDAPSAPFARASGP